MGSLNIVKMEGSLRMLEQPSRFHRDRPFVILPSRNKHIPSQRPERRSTTILAASVLKEVPTWQQLSACAGASALESYVLRPKEVPRSAPTPTLPTEADAQTDKPVLLYRDTNAWCPYCERVTFALAEKDVPYDSVLIDLRDKPAWYTDIVPTALTPAARINGELVWESMDILQRLEREFTEFPLLPSDANLKAEADAVMGASETLSGAGFRFVAGGSLATRPDDEKPGPASDSVLADMQAAFEEQLTVFEQQLTKHEGPFLLGEFSLVDIVYAPAMERLAANLPVMRGFRLRDNPKYPATAAWYQALDERPAYQKVKSDDTTHNLIFKKIFGVPLAAAPASSPAQVAARKEAAAKIAANRTAVVNDLLKNSGIVRGRSNQYGNTLRAVNGYPMEPSPAAVAAVEYALRRLCSWLLHGTTGPRHPDLEAAALGSAALVFFAGRASSPRDLSAAACSELREGCWQLLKDMY